MLLYTSHGLCHIGIVLHFQVGKGNAEVALKLVGYDDELKVRNHLFLIFIFFFLYFLVM